MQGTGCEDNRDCGGDQPGDSGQFEDFHALAFTLIAGYGAKRIAPMKSVLWDVTPVGKTHIAFRSGNAP